MATLAANMPTLADVAKTVNPDGTVAKLAEMLSQTNPILDEMSWYPGNLPTGHRLSMRTGLPTVYWRAYNQGIPSSKSTRAQVDETCAMLEARSDVDIDLVKLNNNSAAFRLSEARAFIEAMNQQMAETLIYGSLATDPKSFPGLAFRYSTISGATNGANVIDAGGVGTDNTSIWLVVWGPETVYGIYPRGSTAGLQHRDIGEIDAFDPNNNRYRALSDLYKWDCGLALNDWRYVVRIANIDTSDFLAQSGTQASTASTAVINLMLRALYRIPTLSMGRAAFYMGRTAHEAMSVAALNKSSNVLAVQQGMSQFGTPQNTTTFMGVPIRLVDRILSTESRVV